MIDQATLDAALATARCFGGQTVDGWTFDLSITVPLAMMLVLHAIGSWRLWRRAGIGHGVSAAQALLFAAGFTALVVGLMSPLHDLSRRLFTAHMIEHEVMLAIAAPLLVAARPLGAMLWALPQHWRRRLGAAAHWRPLALAWSLLTIPLVATMLHGTAIWMWHAPRLFDMALAHEPLHRLQHFSFFATALLFWWSLEEGHERAAGPGAAVGYLFATALHTSFLGVLLVFSPMLWYAAPIAAADWGLTGLEDQQLAGLIMWVPGGLIYAGAALVKARAWIADQPLAEVRKTTRLTASR
jgi:cytochrome c oxidase assembly factor CtaG